MELPDEITEIFYQAQLSGAAKGEVDMHQNSAAQTEPKKGEREKVLKESRRLENRRTGFSTCVLLPDVLY